MRWLLLDKAETAIGPHPDILTYEGYVWRHKGDWAKAEDFYRQALAIDPSHRGSHRVLRRAEGAEGRRGDGGAGDARQAR